MPTSRSDRRYIRATGTSPMRELAWVAEYLAITYPKATTYTNLRLPYPPGAIRRAQGADFGPGSRPTTYRRADAVIIEGAEITLIEGAFRADIEKIGTLGVYARLLAYCPELSAYRGYPLHLVLLSAIPSPGLEALCQEQGIAFQVYAPPWVKHYIQTLRPRDRRAPLPR